MADARDFGNGKTALWVLENKWRTDIVGYGQLCAALAKEQAGTLGWGRLERACSDMALDLYTRIAELELRAQQAEEA